MKFFIPTLFTLISVVPASYSAPCVGDRAILRGTSTADGVATPIQMRLEITNIRSTQIETRSVEETIAYNPDGSVTVLSTLDDSVESVSIENEMNEITSARLVDEGCPARPDTESSTDTSVVQGESIPSCTYLYNPDQPAYSYSVTFGAVPGGLIATTDLPAGEHNELYTLSMTSYSRGSGSCVPESSE